MMRGVYLLIVIISITCVHSLPTREENKDGTQEDNRLLFESNQKADDNEKMEAETQLSERDAELLRLAKEQNIGKDGPETVEGIGSRTGEEFAHDADGDAHVDVAEDPVSEKVDPGPKNPDKDLHGVLMHGDSEPGKEHEHEEAKEDEPQGEATVVVNKVDEAGAESDDRKVPDGVPKTLDTEGVMHGDEGDHVHDADAKPVKDESGKKDIGGYIVQDFMHDLMHGESGNHEHEDAELNKEPAFRPRDLLKLGLDENMLKGLDLKKMIKDDMDDYNRFMAEKGGDEESVWNIFNSFEFRYFKDGADIADISSRAPKEEEWDDSVVTRINEQHEGEDGIDHLMESVGNAGELTNVHGSRRPQDEEEEEEKEEKKE